MKAWSMRVWRGDAPLWECFWGAGVLGAIVLFKLFVFGSYFLLSFVNGHILELIGIVLIPTGLLWDFDVIPFIVIGIMFRWILSQTLALYLLAPHMIWSLTGTWRASATCHDRKLFLATRIMIVAIFIFYFILLVDQFPLLVSSLKQLLKFPF